MSKYCIVRDCKIKAEFGLKHCKPKYCGKHKKPGMVDLTPKTCQCEGCLTRPVFGSENDKAKYCKNRKKTGMIDVIGEICDFIDSTI